MSAKQWTGMVGVVTLGLIAGAAQAATISYQQGGTNALVVGYTGAQDAELASAANANSQFGTSQGYFRAGVVNVANSSNGVRHGVMRFDLTSLAGQYSTINSVSLTYFDDSSYQQPNNNGGGFAQVYALKPANAAWVENDVTWNNQVQGSATAWAGSGGASTSGTDYDPTALVDYQYLVPSINDFKTITFAGHAGLTLTDLINQWSGNQANNAGILWRSNTEGSTYLYDYLAVTAKEDANLARRPMLTIDYTPVPEPGMMVLASLGALTLIRRRRNA